MENFVIGVAYCLTGALIVLLCKPLAMRKIKPNSWYGFRFRESFLSDEHWYRINEYGARRLIPWALFLALCGAVPLAYALEAPEAQLICGCLPWIPLVLLIPALQSWLFAKSLAEETAKDKPVS